MPPKNIKEPIFQLLSKNFSDKVFEDKLKQLIDLDCDINELSADSKTVLDVALGLSRYHSKIEILKQHGAKTSRELDVVPANIGDRIIAPDDPMATSLAPIEPFDFEANGTLHNVKDFLQANQSPEVHKQLKNCAPAVGLLTEFGDGIGTAFLITSNLIMLSRHCLNGVLLSDLQIQFPGDEPPIEIEGMVEDGALVGLDYAILYLKTKAKCQPLYLSTNRQPIKITVIGNFEEELYFTNFYPVIIEQASVASHQSTYQQSNFGWSGSPYFNESNLVYALHQNAGLERKESLNIAEICERNKESILLMVMDNSLQKVEVKYRTEPLLSFSNSPESQYDEGRNRGLTLGKNPSVKEDYLGGDRNVVCQEVLFRWALKRKALYTGEVKDKKKWIADWSNWEVNVRKENNDERQWVKLNPSQIQMGHKLSAVSYWVYGYNNKNPNLTQFFKDYSKEHTKQQHRAKMLKHNNRYTDYTKPGFKCVEKGNALINRRFMYDARNYRFEWGKLNRSNGDAEKLKFDAVLLKKGVTVNNLKEYRDLRDDRATTPVIRKDLDQRKADLKIQIYENCATFKHK